MKIRGLRWYVAGLLCAATAFNYLDRQTLGLLQGTLERLWGLTPVQYSYITAAWLISYTVMNFVSGRLIDRLGTGRGLSLFVGLWSLADVLHATARTAWQFAGCRALLGASEAANFPAGVKVVAEWFPVRERALAVGIFNAGTAVGAALAAPIVAGITRHFGWRYPFVVGGICGAGWLVAWLAVYRPAASHPWLRGEERARIGPGARAGEARPAPVPLRYLLGRREAWGCIVARVLTDPLSYLFAFWVPRFLQHERGFDLDAIGRYYWIPYVGLGGGNLAGGLVPAFLVRAGWTLNRARKTVMFVASTLLAAAFLLLPQSRTAPAVVFLLTGAMFCHAAWANMTLPAEVFPARVIGTVAGLAGGISALVATATTLAIGRTVAVGSFTPIFILYSALPMLAFGVVCWLVRDLGVVLDVPD